jgi:RNA polymerase sigma factor (sigma-70 family)
MDHLINEIIRRHTALIKRIIRKYENSRSAQEDIYQDVVLHIIQKTQKIQPEELSRWESGAWISTITKNKIIDIIRSNKNKHHTDKEELLEVIANNSDLKQQDHTEMQQNSYKTSIRKLFNKLSETERKLLIMRIINDYPLKEIGTELNLSNPSVTLKRALAKVKELLIKENFNDNYDGLDIDDLNDYIEN